LLLEKENFFHFQDFGNKDAVLVKGPVYASAEEMTSVKDFFTPSDYLFSQSSLLGMVVFEKNGLKRYWVQTKETLSEIAKKFGLSPQTILWANLYKKIIKPGEELIILPVDGILYEVKKGDNLEEIFKKYHLDEALFKKYNPDYQKLIVEPGEHLILPYSKPINMKDLAGSFLPDLKNYFTAPAVGWYKKELDEKNAVEILNHCGTPIFAAAEGLVVKEVSNNSYNDGYGNYLIIEHPNGTKTLYAHTEKNLKTVGDYVKQKEEIALMGNSGASLFSSCSLRFEVYGAKNPFSLK